MALPVVRGAVARRPRSNKLDLRVGTAIDTPRSGSNAPDSAASQLYLSSHAARTIEVPWHRNGHFLVELVMNADLLRVMRLIDSLQTNTADHRRIVYERLRQSVRRDLVHTTSLADRSQRQQIRGHLESLIAEVESIYCQHGQPDATEQTKAIVAGAAGIQREQDDQAASTAAEPLSARPDTLSEVDVDLLLGVSRAPDRAAGSVHGGTFELAIPTPDQLPPPPGRQSASAADGPALPSPEDVILEAIGSGAVRPYRDNHPAPSQPRSVPHPKASFRPVRMWLLFFTIGGIACLWP